MHNGLHQLPAELRGAVEDSARLYMLNGPKDDGAGNSADGETGQDADPPSHPSEAVYRQKDRPTEQHGAQKGDLERHSHHLPDVGGWQVRQFPGPQGVNDKADQKAHHRDERGTEESHKEWDEYGHRKDRLRRSASPA
jgi:hypothetical protein